MKKLILAFAICCAFAVSGSHAFDMECDRQCHICDEMYKLRVRLGGEYLKEALEYCRNALDYCKSVGEDCWQATGHLKDHNEL
ncbi:hypothetical protein [Candidatus Endomicrobiellum devescovinae]|jgi:hypothetical protein|uniref:hypothetical protein n=1 Tax=Candidatus Endomicrobiellum devescovinae TaxID=3242322 RepID=UPI00282D682A|nr:hypothetical protein [Endomicrobium sp.]